jgi:CSLREA domain-containing protein
MVRALTGVVAAGALLLSAGAAQAATFTVTDTTDSTPGTDCNGHPTSCTLREAIKSADSPGTDTITVTPGHYTLTHGELRSFATATTEITGTGTAADVVIDADGDSRVLQFDGPSILRHLTVTGGASPVGPLSGAGILASGALTLDDVVVSDNHIAASGALNATGGGIWVGASLTVAPGSSATVSGNSVETAGSGSIRGGGVFLSSGATSLDLSRVNVTGNLAQSASGVAEGGGIGIDPGAAGTLTVTGTVADNVAKSTSSGAASGGGAWAPGAVTLSGARFTGNTASADATNAAGGGLWVRGALTASGGVQFVGNTVNTDSTWSARGGAIYLESTASGTLTDITLRGNQATSAGGIASGGGIFSSTTNPVQLTRALLDANQAMSTSGAISQAYGGGLATILNSSTQIEDSRVTGNLAESAGKTYGGGADAIGTLQVLGTTFDANRAVSHRTTGGDAALGGGAYAHATSSLQNTTFTGNSATTTTSSGTTGGGGLAIDASLAVSGSTISGNTSHSADDGGVGGGILADGPLIIGGSILSGNTSDSGPDCSGVSSNASGGGNVLPVDLGCLTSAVTSDRLTDTPGLGALGDHGGFAPTMLLDPTSQAVGRNSVSCPTFDERGFSRGSAPCDAGAVEMRPANLTATPGALAFGSVATDATGTLPVTLTNSGDFPAPVAISGPDATSFGLSGCPTAILGVTSCVATISFAPRALGAASATLTPAVALTGTGVPAPSRGSIPTCRDLDLGTTTGAPVLARLDCSPGVWDWVITARPEHGTLSPIGDRGEVTYTPDPGYRGDDRFRYVARGGAGRSNVATAVIRVDSTEPTRTTSPTPTPRTCTATVRLNPKGTRFVRVRVSGAPATVKRTGQIWRATVTVSNGHATLHLSGRRPDGGLTKRTLSVDC